jgi:hypothetical protein
VATNSVLISRASYGIYILAKGSEDTHLFGSTLQKVTELMSGAATPEDGLLKLSYADGKKVTDQSLLNDPHLSVHASGFIHAAGDRFVGASLRGLSQQQALCFVLFQQVDSFEGIAVGSIKKRDVCLNYPVDNARPLSAQLYVAPRGSEHIVIPPSAMYQVNLLFIYSSLIGVPDWMLQLVLHHGPEGPWPPATYLLFPAQDG